MLNPSSLFLSRSGFFLFYRSMRLTRSSVSWIICLGLSSPRLLCRRRRGALWVLPLLRGEEHHASTRRSRYILFVTQVCVTFTSAQRVAFVRCGRLSTCNTSSLASSHDFSHETVFFSHFSASSLFQV